MDLTVDVSDVPDSEVNSQLGVLVPDLTDKAALGWVRVRVFTNIYRLRIK